MKTGTIAFSISIMVLFIISFSLAQVRQPIRPAAPLEPQKDAPAVVPSEFKPIDPNQLRQLQSMPSRPSLINTLMGNPTTRGMIESAAKKAGMRVNELTTKGIDKKTVQTAAVGNKIEELNWNAGIKFSLIKNRPTFFDPQSNTVRPLGNLGIWGTILQSHNAAYSFSNDIFVCETVNLEFNLPKWISTYIITVQGIIPTDTQFHIYTAGFGTWGGDSQYPNFLPLGNVGGVVGIVELKATKYFLSIHFPAAEGKFGSITITRL